MERMDQAKRPALLILLAVPIILISGTFSYRSMSRYQETGSQIALTQDFLRAANSLRLELRRAESGQRGFLLTGRDSYLRPYRNAIPAALAALSTMDHAMIGDDRHRERIREISRLARQKLDELSRTIELYRQGNKDQAMQLVLSDQGDQAMADISARMDEMIASDRDKLDVLRADAAVQARKSFLVGTGGDLILLLLIVFAGLWLDREHSRRERDQEAIHSLNEQLALELQERDGLLHDVQEARALLDTLFENAPVGLGVWDLNLRFMRVNRAMAEMNGIPADQHVGKTVAELLPGVREGVDDALKRVIGTGESVLGRETIGMTPAKPEKERTWIASYYPIRIAGQIRGAGAVWEEITERKAMEGSMRQVAKLESLGVLAGGIAHDFNNLLTGILGNASLAADTLSANNPARAILDDVVTASERAAHLTRQLLAYAGKGRFILQQVDLSGMVREISALVRLSIPRTVQLRFELTDQLPGVLADMSQMQQLVMNLVINAAEAVPAGQQGTVVIGTGTHEIDESYILQTLSPGEITPGQYVFLEVHDTGVGMDEATIARIFDPFFTTKFTGRGLGLAAVLGIVRGHKGALKVYSSPGKGTTFKVLLPVSEQVVTGAVREQRAISLNGSGTVLVIDDEELVRRTTKTTLERYGYSVILADNGRDGVNAYRALADRVSVVLLDLTMPMMSGEDALREIRAINPRVKVILSSGFNEVEAVQRFTGKGLAGFLQKPYTAQHLAETVYRISAAD
jgi:PAS domain S-box-containing protein